MNKVEEEKCENLNTTEQSNPPNGAAKRQAFLKRLLSGSKYREYPAGQAGYRSLMGFGETVSEQYPILNIELGVQQREFENRMMTIGGGVSEFPIDADDFCRRVLGMGSKKISTRARDGFVNWYSSNRLYYNYGGSVLLNTGSKARVSYDVVPSVIRYEEARVSVKTFVSSGLESLNNLKIDDFTLDLSQVVVEDWGRKNATSNIFGVEPIVSRRPKLASELLSASVLSKSTLVSVYELLKESAEAAKRLGGSFFDQLGIEIVKSVRNLIFLKSKRILKFKFCDGLDFLRKSLVKRLFYIYPSEEDERGKYAVCPFSSH